MKELIKGVREMGLTIRVSHWKPEEGAGETLMDYLRLRESDEKVLNKMNMCRIFYRVVCVDELYDMNGGLCRSGNEMSHSMSTLRWQSADILTMWKKWWWDDLDKRLPG